MSLGRRHAPAVGRTPPAAGRRHVAQAVVDHFEAVQIEEQHGEVMVRDRGVMRAMERSRRSMNSTRLGKPVRPSCSASRSSCSSASLRAVMSVCEPAMRVAFAAVVANRSAAGEHPAVAAVGVQHAVFDLEVRRDPFAMGGDGRLHRFQVIGMDAVEPFIRQRADLRIRSQPEHFLPAGGEINLPACAGSSPTGRRWRRSTARA